MRRQKSFSSKIPLHLCGAAFLGSIFPLASFADDALTTTLTPDPRPYPYAILDTQPGVADDQAQSLFEERMMIRMVPEDVHIRVQNGEGQAITLQFAQEMLTSGVGPSTFLGNEPYAQMRMLLASEVMDGRVLRIARTLRQPTTELPDPAAPRAQIEDLYGPPSRIKFDDITQAMTLTYACSDSGFIADLGHILIKGIPNPGVL